MNNNTHLPQIEHTILGWWRDQDIFAKTMAARRNGPPFVFYDGPPFTTGLPHYGHILQMAIKDAVLRYQTMQGYNVPRKIGWDTHGLPVEYELEKELNLSGKRAIEDYGIEKFVEAARSIVLRCTTQWKVTMERMGRWVDTSHPYTTMDTDYIESVWWAFRQLYDKGLVYKDYRVSPYCPRCGTVLSNFEVNQGYQDNVSDTSVYVKLRVVSPGPFCGASLIFWTTTPWTIPAVVAMSVAPQSPYAVFKAADSLFIMARDRVGDLFTEFELMQEVKGEDLLGLVYESPYKQEGENLFRVVVGEHVTTTDGTGIASIAPAYGEIDAAVGKEEGLPTLQTVEPDGTIKREIGLPGEGLFVKDAERYVITDLSERGFLVKEEKIKHTYPFCWRCHSPLLYFPTTSWFVKVTALQEKLVAENKKIQWLPGHLRDGRFGRWLAGARDWAISRDRYWGAPLPIWECSGCQEFRVIASREELGLEAGFDLHRPFIDAVKLPCECGGEMTRVPFVFDCWFESGSMPFAQHHFPFAGKSEFQPEEGIGYPADFIAEALDQTRGWFYTLHVLGVALFGQRAFQSVVVSGLLLAPDGKKLSKSLRNYTSPDIVMDEQGVDALRLFLFTATTLGEDYRFSDDAVKDVKRRWLTPLLNVLHYYDLALQDQDESVPTTPASELLDTWMKARLVQAQLQVGEAMSGSPTQPPFDLVRACRTFGPLVEDLSTWYIRLSRGRKDKAFTDCLRSVLLALSQLYAPFLPFITEHIYQSVKGPEDLQSVHMSLLALPEGWQSNMVLDRMEVVRASVSAGRTVRSEAGIPVRQPLSRMEIRMKGDKLGQTECQLIAAELQIDQVTVVDDLGAGLVTREEGPIMVGLDTTLTQSLRAQGQANLLRRTIQDLRKQANLSPGDQAIVWIAGIEPELAALIQEQLTTTQIVTVSPNTPLLGEAVVETLHVELYQP